MVSFFRLPFSIKTGPSRWDYGIIVSGGDYMKHYELIIFDADGTLLDYDRAEHYAFNNLCSEVNIECTDDLIETYHTVNSGLWKEFEKRSVTIGDLKYQRFQKTFERLELKADARKASEIYLNYLGEAGFCIPGAKKTLETLKQDRQLALLTNGIAATQHTRLEKAGIKHYFHPIVISEEAGCQKPDVQIFSYLFERALYQDKVGTLMVGDSLSSDIAGGNAFGIDTCLITFGKPVSKLQDSHAKPTYTVGSFEQLLELLK